MGRNNLICLAAFFLAMALFPLLVQSPYYLRVINFAGIYSLVCLGLSLLMGYAGQISIGQAGFFAIGAYASGILTTQFGASPLVGLIAGLIVNGLVASLVGIPTLRLRGHYLAMATLGIGELIHIVALADTEDLVSLIQAVGVKLGYAPTTLSQALAPYRALTGGPSGFSQIPTLSLGAWKLNTPVAWFYLIWFLVFLSMVLALNLINSRIGRALRAIHGNEEAAGAMGINIPRVKLVVFVLSALMASLAGSLYAHYVTFISPVTFSINESLMFVVMVSVGGMMNVWGALLGSVIMTVLPESLRFFHDYDILVYGLILLVIMMFIPQGLAGLLGWPRKPVAK
ncbi:MAG: branched-chain amino acid ABC transporter permease [Thermodesulfobacteriota bacterium]